MDLCLSFVCYLLENMSKKFVCISSVRSEMKNVSVCVRVSLSSTASRRRSNWKDEEEQKTFFRVFISRPFLFSFSSLISLFLSYWISNVEILVARKQWISDFLSLSLSLSCLVKNTNTSDGKWSRSADFFAQHY